MSKMVQILMFIFLLILLLKIITNKFKILVKTFIKKPSFVKIKNTVFKQKLSYKI